MENELIINGLDYHVSYCEAIGLSKCFEAYGNECANEYIHQVGFNPNSGYVYIALEIGVQICSMLGNDVVYLITDFDNGQEYFFSNYKEAELYLEKMTNDFSVIY